jgi:outer membrane protein OmpA-like peptidoglycan-associated protein
MVVRDYLAQNFKFDDTRLKTIGLGKEATDARNEVPVLLYTSMPADGSKEKERRSEHH